MQTKRKRVDKRKRTKSSYLVIQNPKGERKIEQSIPTLTGIQVPWVSNGPGTIPRDKESAELLNRPGMCFGEIFKLCTLLKYSIPARSLSPIP